MRDVCALAGSRIAYDLALHFGVPLSIALLHRTLHLLLQIAVFFRPTLRKSQQGGYSCTFPPRFAAFTCFLDSFGAGCESACLRTLPVNLRCRSVFMIGREMGM